MKQKTKLIFDFGLEVYESGGVFDVLNILKTKQTFEGLYGLRHPLGIYNVSIARISYRISRAAGAVGDFMRANAILDRSGRVDPIINDICDDIEGCIYAAAEHVDDLESCLTCLFSEKRFFAKNEFVKKFKNDLSIIRRNVSAFANLIKHNQARIRIYQLGFVHEDNPMTLIGFFVEGVEDGVIGPSPVHGDNQIISVSSFFGS